MILGLLPPRLRVGQARAIPQLTLDLRTAAGLGARVRPHSTSQRSPSRSTSAATHPATVADLPTTATPCADSTCPPAKPTHTHTHEHTRANPQRFGEPPDSHIGLPAGTRAPRAEAPGSTAGCPWSGHRPRAGGSGPREGSNSARPPPTPAST
eukprot:1184265-Prorocentrum_minimum.AAC.1